MIRTATAALLLLTLLSQTPAHAQDLVPGRMWHDGQQRTFVVHVPDPLPPGPLPVWLILHGTGGTGAGTADSLDTNAIADREGVIAIYPDAIGDQWNDGRAYGKNGDTTYLEHDDVGFLDRLLDRAVQRWNGDPWRIYVTGVSNGGLMALRLGVEIGDRLAAVSAIIANLAEPLAQVQPRAPVAVLLMNGTEDNRVPYDGGPTGHPEPLGGPVLSAYDTVDYFVANNGGAVEVTDELLPNPNRRDRSRVRRVEVRTPTGAPVVLYEIQGGGHQIPSTAPGPDFAQELGPRNRDIEGIEEVWAFLAAQTR